MRQKFSIEEKKRICEEALSVGNINLVAERNGIRDTTLHYWLKNSKSLNDPDSNLSSKDHKKIKKQFNEMQKKINKLKQIIGEKELENMILKDLAGKK